MSEKEALIANVPRVALRWPTEAAQALGISPDTLERHGAIAGVRVWRLGSIRLVAVDELRHLGNENAAPVPGGELEPRGGRRECQRQTLAGATGGRGCRRKR